MRKLFAYAWILLLVAGIANAQTPAEVVSASSGFFSTNGNRLQEYANDYFAGRYEALAAKLRSDFTKIDYGTQPPIKLSSNFVSVVFVATPPAQKDRAVVRFLLPPDGVAVTSPPQHLPGTKHLYEAFLSDEKASRMSSAWTSTQKESPLRAQFVKLAKAATGTIAGFADHLFMAKTTAVTHATQKHAQNPIYIVINDVTLPHARADIQIATRLRNAEVTDAADLLESFQTLRDEIASGIGRISPCAVAIADKLNGTAISMLTGSVVTVADRKDLVKQFNKDIDYELTLPVCTDELSTSDGSLIKARADVVRETRDKFLDTAGAGGDPITGTSELKNVPFQRVSLGLISGAMIHRSGDTHFTVDGGKLAPKPLSGLFTAAALHIHPIAYDPEASTPSFGERFSGVVAFVTTPAPGVEVGTSVRFFRGLGVHLGYAAMVVDRLKPDFQAGQEVTVTDDPFRRGITRAWIVGINYDFD